jgi:hypothetical protein
MASTTILNAAPLVISRGVQDLSTREQLTEGEAIPTHLPKVYVYAAKGPNQPTLVSGASRTNIFGADSFDLRKPFANHQTVLSNLLSGEGNAQMIERIIPDDVGPRANFLLSLDVVQDDVVQYQRNPDGSIVFDVDLGTPVAITPTVKLPGFRAKWVLTRITTLADENKFGSVTNTPGDMVSTLNGGMQSTRYPILQFWAASYGSVFNNSAIRLSAPTESSAIPLNVQAMADLKAYPYRLSVIRRATEVETPRPVSSLNGDQYIDFVLKPDAIFSVTDSHFSLEDTFLKSYQNLENNGAPIEYGDFGGLKVYQANIGVLLAQFYAAEYSNAGLGSDFTGAAGEEHLFNLFSGVSSKGEPYYTFQLDSSAGNAVRLSESTNLYAGGASDGTMNDTAFATAVAARVGEYANPNSPLMNTAINVESILYDTGFPLSTKRELCKFISERKDTFVVLSPYVVGGPEMTASEEHSVGIALKTYLQMYPESDYFGTAVMRGMVVGRYGVLTNSQYRKKLPLTIQVAVMAAKMMGAADGKWKEGMVFDRYPNSEITMFENINVTYTPATVRNSDWELGLNWVQSFSRKSFFFPALKTIYDNDSSVLNSFFVAMAAVELQKVGERVWREYSGSVRLTNEQLVDRINAAVEAKTIGRFCDMFKIVPEAYLSAADETRGYSWTLPISLYANNMRTVMVLDVRARRMTDLAAA